DNSGKVLEEGPSEPVQAIDPALAAAVTDVLKGVIESGTAQKADIGRPAAGKTGTSQLFTNAWFVGYTPELSTSVWMGYRKGDVRMSLVHGVRDVTGGSIPAQMWSKYMGAALEGVPPAEFAAPGTSALGGLGLPPRTRPTPSPSPTPSLSFDPLAPYGWAGASPTPSPSPTPDPFGGPGGLLGGLFPGGYISPTPSPNPTAVTPTPSPT
ncbi:MAG: penicillin-binding transpeptidase domain-containing protein, partial [Actinomycetota bacterium]